MKKTFFIAALFALSAAAVQAQTIGFGVTAGMNITKPESGKLQDWKPDYESSWYMGIQAKVTLPILGLGADGSLLYSQDKISDATINSLCLPIHLRYDLQLPGITPFAFAGPQFAYNLTDDFEFEAFKGALVSADTKAFTTKFDLGFGVVLANHLQIAYSYSIPMSDSFELDYSKVYHDASNNFQLGTHRLGATFFF